MAIVRAALLFAALAVSFLFAAPLQWVVARFLPRGAHLIPLVFCRTLLAIMRVRVVVTGARAAAAPALVASNHVSWIDILAYGGLRPFCFLAKSDVGEWPIVSAFAGVQGTVFVDRKRRRSIPVANRGLADQMLRGRIALLFPEATTFAGPMPGRFHSSHYAASRDLLRRAPDARTVAVQPAAIAYSAPHAAWIGDDALLPHLWRVLNTPPLTCEIAFATPIPFAIGSDRKAVAKATREAVVALLESRAATAAAVSRPLGRREPDPASATHAATRC